jgi:hypothetical protein
MSDEIKKQADQIKKFFQTVEEGTKQAGKEAVKFDKDLSKKIQKVEKAAEEVVKHVEKKSE